MKGKSVKGRSLCKGKRTKTLTSGTKRTFCRKKHNKTKRKVM